MTNFNRKLSLGMATIFTAFTMLSATPALGVAKKKVTKKAKKKVVTVKKSTVSAATVAYNNALAAVKVAEGAFKYDMTNPDNISYVKVKADLAQTKVEAVTDSAKQAYLGSRLSVVMNKIATVEANYAAAQDKKTAEEQNKAVTAKGVVSVTALNNTTVVVKFAAAQSIASPADFTFDNGLTVKAAAVKQDDATSVVLNTSAQDSTKTYKLSYKGADASATFTGLAAATTPSAITIATSNSMGTLGTNVTVTATVTPASAGVPVTFNILCDDATKATINTPIVKEVLTDAKGVATVTYARYYGAQDDLSVYPTGSPAIRATGNVYWGSQARLTCTVTSSSASVANQGTVIYKITYLDSTGSAMSNKLVDVMFKENINASGSTANAVNLSTGNVVSQNLYQRDQISDANALELLTDSNGVATFQVTGSNTVATPIIYTDEAHNTYNATTNNYTVGDFKMSTKLKNSFLQITAPTATFSQGTYTITCDQATGSTVTGVTGTSGANDNNCGTTYTITVKKSDGTAYANGTVSVGLQEWMTGGTGSSQTIWSIANNGALSAFVSPVPAANGSAHVASVALNSNGQASFNVNGGTANLLATPVVFVDSNANNIVDNGESTYTCGTSLFVNPAANGISVSGRDTTTAGGSVTTQTVKSATTGAASPLWIRARIKDQSGNLYATAQANIVTFTIQNTGSHPATLKAYGAVADGVDHWLVNGSAANTDYVIDGNTTKTVVVTSTAAGGNVFLQLVGDIAGNNGTTLSIQTSINDVKDGNYYSQAAQTYTFVSPNTLPTNGVVKFTGTVTGFTNSTTVGRVILKLDGSGDAEDLVFTMNDTYTLGTDFTNVSYIPVKTFAYDLSTGDRIQATCTFVNGAYTTAWALINVDGSSDSSVDYPQAPAAPVTTYLTAKAAAKPIFGLSQVTATIAAAQVANVTKITMFTGTTSQGDMTITAGAASGSVMANSGDTVTLKLYNGTTLLTTETVTVASN